LKGKRRDEEERMKGEKKEEGRKKEEKKEEGRGRRRRMRVFKRERK
jgi:hypothetical protein